MKLSALILDPSAQPRVKLDETVIEEYTEAMQEGNVFPPLVVYGTDRRAWLADGWHRYHAAQQAGLTEIDVDLREGTLSDAVWHSISANAEHGLRRSNADKNRAVTTALTINSALSDVRIAEHCSVHRSMVARVRASLEKNGVIEASPVREIVRDGAPSQQRVKAPKTAQTPVLEPDTDSDTDETDDPFSSDESPFRSAPTPIRTEPEREPVRNQRTAVATPTDEQPIDEDIAVAVIKRYRRLRLFNPIRAALLLGRGDEPMTIEEVERIGGWFINVAEEMTLKGMP
jgi:hypothetical protein